MNPTKGIESIYTLRTMHTGNCWTLQRELKDVFYWFVLGTYGSIEPYKGNWKCFNASLYAIAKPLEPYKGNWKIWIFYLRFQANLRTLQRELKVYIDEVVEYFTVAWTLQRELKVCKKSVLCFAFFRLEPYKGNWKVSFRDGVAKVTLGRNPTKGIESFITVA